MRGVAKEPSESQLLGGLPFITQGKSEQVKPMSLRTEILQGTRVLESLIVLSLWPWLVSFLVRENGRKDIWLLSEIPLL